MAEISSSSFDPVFDTLKCDIPEIPPVSNTPLILDCEIPRAIDPIFDCNDIDLQLPISYVAAFAVAVGGAGQPGAQGPKGDDGADGADGEDGCDPVLTISRSVTCVYTVDDVGVEVGVTQTDDCEYNIHFDFSLICGFDYTGTKKGCCWWIWCACDCEDVVALPAAEECGFASTYCSSSRGEWRLVHGASGSTCDEENPPCIKGAYHGQVEIVCDCSFTCFELTNCQFSADVIYTTSDFSAYDVGDAFRRQSAEGGGCYYLSAKNVDCGAGEVEDFTIFSTLSSCSNCPPNFDIPCIECHGLLTAIETSNCNQCARFEYNGGTRAYSIATYIGQRRWVASTTLCGVTVEAMMYCEADPDGPAPDNIKIRLVADGYDQTVDAVDAPGAGWQQGTFSGVDDELDCLTNGEIIVTFYVSILPCCDDGMGGVAQCMCTFPGPVGGCGANPGIDW